MCQYEHGISYEQFLSLPLAAIEALEERRNIRLRYERFNAALVASAMTGANPFDYLPGFEPTPEELKRKEIKRGIAAVFMRLPAEVTPERVQELKARTIARLTEQGVEDPKGLFAEVFPDLK